MSRRVIVLVVAAVVLLLAATLVGIRLLRDDRTPFAEAMALSPGDAARYTWTDWSAVRRQVGAHLDADSTPAQVSTFLSKSYDQDLTPMSALTDSAALLQQSFGWSPATLEWEMFSESTSGAVVIGRLPDSLDVQDLEDDLTELGFDPPGKGSDVWDGSSVTMPSAGGSDDETTPVITHVAFVPDQHLVLTSDATAYLQQAVDHLDDDALPDGVQQVVDASDEPVAAAVYTGDYACTALAMTQADADDQATAAQLVAKAGKVNPVDGFAMAREPAGGVRVAMSFENHDQAVANADSRSRLASGPAPGQYGTFADRFKLGKVAADGDVVTMALHPVAGSSVLSDLSTGPLLFATC
ncbi:hypothetical protein AB3X52_03920 [Nocardioides sp. DS6]|uniref:DUF3352 domain-containing protein n=1 Tax=Nocardioides eburneus TaxID=3231482 RepID=A0ABV3SUZ5_9ACTN